MSARLRRIFAPPIVVALCFGALFALSLVLRVILSAPLFGGPELFLWFAITAATLAVSIGAEFVPSTFSLKRFVLGFLGIAVFLSCALVANWVRTSVLTQPDAQSLWVFALISIAGGLASHVCIGRRSPPRWSERVKDKVPSSDVGVRAAQLNR